MNNYQSNLKDQIEESKEQNVRNSKLYIKNDQLSEKKINRDCEAAQSQCNLIYWGQEKQGTLHKSPQFGVYKNKDVPLPKIYDIKTFDTFCLFITEDGKLYCQGENKQGLLGLGENCFDTEGQIREIIIGKNEQVIDAKVGKKHALVLTQSGRVYGWGDNSNGQVGAIPEQSKKERLEQSNKSTNKKGPQFFYTPKLVYPSLAQQQEVELEYLCDTAKQIEVYENSSFLVTDDGVLYSWGKNENSFLARDPQLDIKQLSIDNNLKKLNFSTLTPGKVIKLQGYHIYKIKVDDGKIFAFLTERISYDENGKVSEVESAEENDSVHEIRNDRTPEDKSNKGLSANQNITSDINGEERKNTNRSRDSVNASNINIHTTQRIGGGGGGLIKRRNNDKDSKNIQETIYILQQAQDLREDLNKFDLQLADSIKPLLDIQDKNIYQQVLEKFTLGQYKDNDVEELRAAIDRIQIHLKKHIKTLDTLESKISLINGKRSLIKGEDELADLLNILIELLKDCVIQKKLNLVGCKIKIYQQRLRDIKQDLFIFLNDFSFLEMMATFKNEKEIDIDTTKELLDTCKMLSKKIQQQLKKNQDKYLHLHINCSIPSSITLSVLTNSVYTECDIWNGLNSLNQYTYVLQQKLYEVEQTNDTIRILWSIFQELQQTDFNRIAKQFEKQRLSNPSPDEWFKGIIEKVLLQIDNLMGVAKLVNENQKDNENEIITYFRAIINDDAYQRKLMYQAQQSLLKGVKIPYTQQKSSKITSLIEGGTQL